MNKRTRTPVLAAALAAFVAIATPAQAQSTYDDNQQLIAQIQSDKRAVVLKAMDLDDATVVKFTPHYDAYQAERKVLMERGVDLLNTYAANYASMTDDAAKGLMKDWFKLKSDEVKLTEKYAKKMLKDVPAAKVMRFVQVENKLNTLLSLPAIRAIPLAQ